MSHIASLESPYAPMYASSHIKPWFAHSTVQLVSLRYIVTDDADAAAGGDGVDAGGDGRDAEGGDGTEPPADTHGQMRL